MRPLHLFEGFGVELEYMVVGVESLDVRPIVDELLRIVAGTDEFVSDVEFGPIAWSNELVLHVLEFKTNGPAGLLSGLDELFLENVVRANGVLADLGARLLPTGMHPWMDPHAETHLWPHDTGPVYAAFDRLFDCRGHGWSNLQSMHLNLPFADDAEFARLHTATRLVLPILPGLAASSPFADGRATGMLDTRMEIYRHNTRRIPSVTGRVIPEQVLDHAGYESTILAPMYADVAPFDPEGLLQDEFLNARGAIARFSRNTIEIRVLDVQECPSRDLTICATIVALLRGLVGERHSSFAAQHGVSTESLERILLGTIREGDRHEVDDADFLSALGLGPDPTSVGTLWRSLAHDLCVADDAFADTWGTAIRSLLAAGPLARRVLRRTGNTPDRGMLRTAYLELADCLAGNIPLVPED